ncbi:MAG: phosphoribosylformylglycinamidine cyclo-ligase, partial [Pyrinomonadaceae bacterium]|nr:phosphoribosylformylglycinamidine cyclo-ligase [Pyrinomonadaceae bacterium]
GMTVGQALLEPHLSYLPALEELLDTGALKGLAHITGGGLVDNIPRILPAGTAVEIKRGSWPQLSVFTLMQRLGNVSETEMHRTFNMGVGMVIVCAPGADAQAVRAHVEARSESVYEIGRVVAGGERVVEFV